jgi:death-on-curing protein
LRSDPGFLTFEEVLAIHADQIRRYGGAEGIRDEGLLHSAVAAPQSTFSGAFLHQDLHEMAAAYLYSLTANHPFVDGNKRCGVAATGVFLRLNGWMLTATQDALVEVGLGVARGDWDKAQVTEFLRRNSQRL